jgi:hypothetical protein
MTSAKNLRAARKSHRGRLYSYYLGKQINQRLWSGHMEAA